MGTTFALATLAWIFFRADSIGQAFSYIEHVFSKSLMSVPKGSDVITFVFIMLLVEWLQRNEEHGLDFSNRNIPSFVRIIIYYVLIGIILLFGGNQEKFIYFQF